MAADVLKDLVVRIFYSSDDASKRRAEGEAERLGDSVRRAFSFNELYDAATNVFGLVRSAAASVHQVAASADALGDMAERVGTTTEELQFLQFALEESGGRAETAADAYRSLSKAMGAAANGSAETAQAFSALGVSLTADGQSRSAGEVFDDVIAGLQAIPNETDRAARAMKIFGGSWQEISTMLKGGPEQLAALREEFDGLGLAISPEFVDLADRYDKVVRRLSASWQSFKSAALQPVIKELTALSERFLEWYRLNRLEVTAKVTQGFTDLTRIVGAMGDVFMSVWQGAVVPLYTSLSSFIEELGPWGGLVESFGELLAIAFVSPKAGIIALGATIAQDLLYYFTDKGPSAVGYFLSHWDESIAHLRKTQGAFVADFVEGVAKAVAWVVNAIRKATFYVSGLFDIWNNLQAGKGNAFSDLKKLFGAQGDVDYLEQINADDFNKKYGALSPNMQRERIEQLTEARQRAFQSTTLPASQSMSVAEVNMSVNVQAAPGESGRALMSKIAEESSAVMQAEVRKAWTSHLPSRR